MLLDAASDDLVDPDQIRRLLKDLREVRMAKMRSGVDVLDDAAIGGGGVALTGVGAMELGEERGFLSGVVDGLRYVILVILYCQSNLWRELTDFCSKIGASKEQARREQLAEQRATGGYDGTQDEEEDYMEF